MWKESHRAPQGRPRLLFLEALEERHLFAHGPVSGITPLQMPPPPAPQVAIVNPASAAGDLAGADGSHGAHAGVRKQATKAAPPGHDKPTPPDPKQPGPTGLPPGRAKALGQDGGAAGPAPTTSDPGPQIAAPPEADGSGPQMTPAVSARAASQVNLQPPAGEAAGTAAPAGPARETGGPAPMSPGDREAEDAGTAAAQAVPLEGDASLQGLARPNEVNVQDDAPPGADPVVSPGAGPHRPTLAGAASLRAPTDAALGPGQGDGWLGVTAGGVLEEAFEVTDVLDDGPPGSPDVLPRGTVPLSQGEGLVGEFLPFDAQALGAGLWCFLGRFATAGRQLGGLPRSAWLLAAAALAAAGEFLRRRAQADLAAADERQELVRWSPDLGPTAEDA
jgi:hypothetical protein